MIQEEGNDGHAQPMSHFKQKSSQSWVKKVKHTLSVSHSLSLCSQLSKAQYDKWNKYADFAFVEVFFKICFKMLFKKCVGIYI